MMKVILDTSIVHGEGQSSYRYFSELIPRLQKEPEVNLEIVPSPYFELPLSWFPEKPAYQPIQTKARWLPQGKLRQLFSKAKNKVETYRQKRALYQNPEHTLFHSFYYTTPVHKQAQLVVVAHDATLEKLSDSASQNQGFTEHLKSKKKSLLAANRIIAVSESTKNDICEIYGISPNKVDRIYHAASIDFFPKTEIQKSFPYPYLLQVGGRMHHRNFQRLLEAFASANFHKDYLLICAGEAWSDEELTLMKQLGISDRVKLIKNPPNEVLRSLYQQAKMLIYPSLYEGFGFPLIEAMACGTPVATSMNAGSIPEVAADAAHYFDPRDPSDMAKIINELLDPALAQSYVQKGFENLKRFSWDKTAQETLDCYRKVFSA